MSPADKPTKEQLYDFSKILIEKQLKKDTENGEPSEYDGSTLVLGMDVIQKEFEQFIDGYMKDENTDADVELDGIDAFIKATEGQDTCTKEDE